MTGPGQEGEPKPFERKKKTYWLSPPVLLDAARYATVSQLLGRYQDKRETMGSLPADEPLDLRRHREGEEREGEERDEVWFDFVSDTGDGFDATYAIASLVGRPSLVLPGPDGVPGAELPRGELLVLGGDECYPRGEEEEYEHRFVGPYREAFPGPPREPGTRKIGPPYMLALPGNHDWYDGLTAFTRTFLQQDDIGGWQTVQSRSYFAVELPGTWWLWAIDIQFDSYVDVVQHRWLEQMAKLLDPGDSVILCTAKPAWTSVEEDHEDYRTIDYVERTFVRPRKAQIRMILSGDKHHYSRYQSADERHYVTAGGGGAYLTATHHLPKDAQVPHPGSKDASRSEPVRVCRQKTYPDAGTSRHERWGVFRLPLTTTWFAALVGALHALVALVLLWATGAGVGRVGDRLEVLGAAAGELGWAETLGLLDDTVTTLLVALLVLAATGGLTARGWWGGLIGLPHATLQLLVAVTATWLGARLGAAVWGDGAGWTGVGVLLVALVVALLVGAVVGCELVALSFLVGDLARINTNELFAAQAIEDHKCFLRIHVDREAGVTVYPVGLDAVPRQWRTTPPDSGPGPRIEPVHPMRPHLIEPEFHPAPTEPRDEPPDEPPAERS